jgi:hypothetical protein
MKAGKELRVPLGASAVELPKALPREEDNEHLWWCRRQAAP